jgi:hypothetical protein
VCPDDQARLNSQTWLAASGPAEHLRQCPVPSLIKSIPASWSDTRARQYHHRTKDKIEAR